MGLLIGLSVVTLYDRGSTFPQNRFLNDGVPYPLLLVGMPILLKKKTILYTWDMGLFIGCNLFFCWSQFSGELWSSIGEALQKL